MVHLDWEFLAYINNLLEVLQFAPGMPSLCYAKPF